MDRWARNKLLKAKSSTPIYLKAKMSINEHNKGNKDRVKFGYMITNNSRETLLFDKKIKHLVG